MLGNLPRDFMSLVRIGFTAFARNTDAPLLLLQNRLDNGPLDRLDGLLCQIIGRRGRERSENLTGCLFSSAPYRHLLRAPPFIQRVLER